MREKMPPDQPDVDSPATSKRSGAYPTRLMTVGIEFSAVVGILCLAGWWLDGKWGTSPWMLLTGLFISTIGGLYKVWRIGKKYF